MSRTVRYAAVLLFLGMLLIVTAPLVAEASSPLEGLWYGEPVHGGATGHVALRVETDGKGRVVGKLSMLDIDVRDLPIGVVRQDGRAVTIGPLALTFDAEEQTLSGRLPEALVPVHEVVMVLRRVKELPPPSGGPPDAPAATARWTFDAKSPVWGGLALAGGRLVFGTDAGEVIALDTATGEPVWRHATKGAIRSRPLVGGEDVVVASDDGHVYRLTTARGELRWKARIGEAIRRPAPGDKEYQYFNYAPSPVMHGDTIYAGSGNDLVAIDAVKGEVVWRRSTDGALSTTPARDGDLVFAGSWDGKLYALDARSGEVSWTHDFGAPVTSSPAVAGNLVVAGSRSYDLAALESKTGRTAWSHYEWFSWIESSPVANGGSVYVGSSDAQKLRALDAGTGETRWVFDTGGSAWAQPAVAADRIFIGSVGVADYLVEHRATFWAIDRATGRAGWRFELARPEGAAMWGFASSPATDGRRAYAATIDGRVFAFGK